MDEKRIVHFLTHSFRSSWRNVKTGITDQEIRICDSASCWQMAFC